MLSHPIHCVTLDRLILWSCFLCSKDQWFLTMFLVLHSRPHANLSTLLLTLRFLLGFYPPVITFIYLTKLDSFSNAPSQVPTHLSIHTISACYLSVSTIPNLFQFPLERITLQTHVLTHLIYPQHLSICATDLMFIHLLPSSGQPYFPSSKNNKIKLERDYKISLFLLIVSCTR